MKPDWDKLMRSYNKSKRGKTGLIADVDCTGEGKPLCEEHGVKGFPALKWGDPSALEDYQGGRDYDTLKKFVLENIKPMCSIANLDLCTEEKKNEIEAFQALPVDQLRTQVKEKEDAMKDASDKFDKEVETLQGNYKKFGETKKETIDQIKSSGLQLMKAVYKYRIAQGEKEEL